jgi:nitrite reductase/ring-hydroxylating ferredoxin subunit/uncharacterized membrane protein
MSVEASLRDVTRLMETGDQAQMLDTWSEQLQGGLRTAVEQGGPAARRLKNWLNGVWLGHPLHPALTDVPIGAWMTGFLLDLVGAHQQADAATTIGVLAAVPTALAGAADWSDTEGTSRRMGLVHATLNTLGLGLMVGSLFARRNDNRALGFGLSTAALTLASFSAWLGGKLVYDKGTGITRNAFAPSVDEFQVVASDASLEPGKLTGVELDVNGTKVPLVLVKQGRSVLAIGGVCSHWGELLAGGKLVDGDCVECPWHASRFSLVDGSVRQGPASIPQPVYEARIRNGNVEVRRAH